MRPEPTVALYTDAGVKDGVATWATVAIVPSQRDPIERSGKLREPCDNSATAELRAIANALHWMLARGHIARGARVRVYTDSLHAVDRIRGVIVRRPQSDMAKAMGVITAIALAHGIEVSATKVASHKPDNHSAHARFNNRCDKLCREARAEPKKRPPSKAAKPAATTRETVKVPSVKEGPTAARKALETARQLEAGA